MTPDEAYQTFARLVDGQPIRVVAVSGRVFDGIYNGEHSDPDGYLYFDTMDGKELKAEWKNVQSLDFRNARAYTEGGRMFIPPEHPLSGRGPTPVSATGVPLRPHTSRNR